MIEFFGWLINGFLSTFSISNFYYRITNSSQKLNLKIIIYYLFGVFSSTLIEYFNLDALGSFYYFLYFPLMFYFLNKKRFFEIVYYIIVVWLFGIVIDLFAMLIISIILNFYPIELYIVYFEMIVTLFIFALFMLFSSISKLRSFVSNLYFKILTIKYSTVSLILFSCAILLIGTLLFFNMQHLTINMLLFLILFFIILSFVLLIKYKINVDENERYLKTLKENNDFYIKLDDENRIFKHNLTAKLLSIKSVSNDKAQSLIEDLINQYNKNVKFSEGIKVIPYGLNGIIYEKLYPYITELIITIDNNIDYDIFEYLKPRRYNVFVEKIVVALDNAIESTKNSEDKILSVNIYDEDNKIVVEINNTFGNMIDLDSFGKKSYSTKGKRRGLGIFSALRNNEASMFVKIVNNMFVSKISAKKRLTE